MGYTGEQKREYDRHWRIARRLEWIGNKVCVVCGSDDRLEVDHIDRSTKELSTAALWGMSRNNPKRVAELAKCQILCHYCHLEKTIAEANASRQHGRTLYAHGCRCEICKEAQRKHNAQRYAP